MKHLQSILKKFDNAAAPTDIFLTCYFRDAMRPSIQAQIKKKNRDLDNWQAFVVQAMDAKAKTAWRVFLLAQKSDTCGLYNHRLLHKEKKDQKNSEAKKPNLSANDNSGSGKDGQLV